MVNSTELRDVGFQMDAVDPPPAPVQVVRRTRSASAAPARVATTGRRFRVPVDVENRHLALCW